MRCSFPLGSFALVAACTVVPSPSKAPPAPESSAIGIGQSVRTGAVIVTPISVVEDSRCPARVTCVWAGRLVVRTRIEGGNGPDTWQDTADLRLGESFGTHGSVTTLIAAEPDRTADQPILQDSYRFVYRAG